jgi:hypothetical protein
MAVMSADQTRVANSASFLPETYTVYLRGFEQTGSESGLSFTNAFRLVLALATDALV